MHFTSSHLLVLIQCVVTLLTLCSAQILMKPVYVNESELTPRVVGGTPVVLGEIPYQVGFKARMGFSNRYTTFCGGSIIGERKIVSAAHCFGKAGSSCFESTIIKGRKLARMYAVAGFLFNEGRRPKDDSEGSGQWRRLMVVMYPSKYRFPFRADIAVVVLKRPFRFNAHVNKIPYARTFVDYKGSCLASGYGRLSLKKKIKSEILLKAALTIITNYWCNVKFRRNMKELVCTVSGPTDIAKGDSGGPLVCANTGHPNEGSYGILVGVTSGHRFNVASFFTRVSTFSKYVTQNRTRDHFGHAYFENIFLILASYSIYCMLFLLEDVQIAIF